MELVEVVFFDSKQNSQVGEAFKIGAAFLDEHARVLVQAAMIGMIVAAKRHVNDIMIVFAGHALVLRKPHVVDGNDEVAARLSELLAMLFDTFIVVDVLHLVDSNLW